MVESEKSPMVESEKSLLVKSKKSLLVKSENFSIIESEKILLELEGSKKITDKDDGINCCGVGIDVETLFIETEIIKEIDRTIIERELCV